MQQKEIKMNKKAHIISHTHWDREWYINSKFVNEWLPVFFDGLFDMMEKEPTYRFVLDGQTSMIDDCYAELEKAGRSVSEYKEKIKKYAKQGRLVLGPYYLQPDWQLISDESLVRNMLIGRKMATDLGGKTSTGWLLDNFGQVSQAPQLHKQFGMKGIVLWRGVELDPFNLNSEFLWESPDGTALTCGYLLSSYRNAMHLADFPKIIFERIKNEAEKIEPFATTNNVLLMNGYDQEMTPDNVIPYIKDGKADFKDFKIVQSTPDEYMQAILDGNPKLQKLSGALYSGRYISVFPGILSARMYIKQMNDKAQRQLDQYAEPLSVMTSMLGAEYPHKELESSWKVMLKNAAHDSICGVSVDDVYTDMIERYDESLAISEKITAKAAATLATASDTSEFADAKAVYTVINTMTTARTQNVFIKTDDTDVIVKDSNKNILLCQKTKGGIVVSVEMKAFGVTNIGLYEGTDKVSDNTELSFENKFYTLSVNKNGTLTINDKINNRTYNNVGLLENSADSGDEYNYSFLTGDSPITSENITADISVVEDGDVQKVFRISYEWAIPKSLSDDRSKRSDEKAVLPVVTYVTASVNSPVVSFRTAVRNTCLDHRLRVMFPTGIDTDFSYAQTQFDITRHPIVPREFDNSTIPEEVKRIIIGARECIPITQFPQRDFCAVSDSSVTAAVINKGLPEYEVLKDNTTIALTLFRGISWLTRFDLNTRIGDAGPEIFTPDAQCIRDMEFSYGFCSLTGDAESNELTTLATEFTNPALVLANKAHNGIDISSMLSVKAESSVKITAVKCAEESNDIVVRFYNGDSKAHSVSVNVANGIKNASEATPYEEATQNIAVSDNTMTIDCAKKQIKTIRLAADTNNVAADVDSCEVWTGNSISVDFNNYKLPEVVVKEQIDREEARAKVLEDKLNAKEAEKVAFEKCLDEETATPSQKAQLATLRVQTESIRRAALEARLSAIFAFEKFEEKRLGRDSQEFEKVLEDLKEPLRKIAYKLNIARIDKRVSEYIEDYYNHEKKLSE